MKEVANTIGPPGVPQAAYECDTFSKMAGISCQRHSHRKDSLAKMGVPREVFQAARKPVTEAHNRQETPLFAKSIERHALRNASPAKTAKAMLSGKT